jgi:hypothetical protein
MHGRCTFLQELSAYDMRLYYMLISTCIMCLHMQPCQLHKRLVALDDHMSARASPPVSMLRRV